MDREDLKAKIDWEGGVYEALKYGLTANDIDDENLRLIWADLEEHWADYEKTESKLLDELGMHFL